MCRRDSYHRGLVKFFVIRHFPLSAFVSACVYSQAAIAVITVAIAGVIEKVKRLIIYYFCFS